MSTRWVSFTYTSRSKSCDGSSEATNPKSNGGRVRMVCRAHFTFNWVDLEKMKRPKKMLEISPLLFNVHFSPQSCHNSWATAILLTESTMLVCIIEFVVVDVEHRKPSTKHSNRIKMELHGGMWWRKTMNKPRNQRRNEWKVYMRDCLLHSVRSIRLNRDLKHMHFVRWNATHAWLCIAFPKTKIR